MSITEQKQLRFVLDQIKAFRSPTFSTIQNNEILRKCQNEDSTRRKLKYLPIKMLDSTVPSDKFIIITRYRRFTIKFGQLCVKEMQGVDKTDFGFN